MYSLANLNLALCCDMFQLQGWYSGYGWITNSKIWQCIQHSQFSFNNHIHKRGTKMLISESLVFSTALSVWHNHRVWAHRKTDDIVHAVNRRINFCDWFHVQCSCTSATSIARLYKFVGILHERLHSFEKIKRWLISNDKCGEKVWTLPPIPRLSPILYPRSYFDGALPQQTANRDSKSISISHEMAQNRRGNWVPHTS